MTLAQTMAEYAFSLRYDGLPSEAIATVRRHLADSMACALGAYPTEAVGLLRKYALARGGRGEATLLGTAHMAPAGAAALVNGTMVRYLDANDIFAFSQGHDSGHFSDATPAIVSLAEQHHRSGQELLTCLAASYELQGALAQSFHFMARGFHSLSHVPITLPIIAARLMGATPEVAVNACGLSIATGLVLNTWLKPSERIPMVKGVAVGLAAQRAVEAAELAALGVTASEDALETAFERLRPLSNTPMDLTPIQQPGKRTTVTRNIIKAYPAQIYTQAAIQAALELHRRGVRAERVRRLTLYGHRNVCGGVQGSPEAFAPASREAADHSTPYVMAMALLRGRMTLREYEDAPWQTPQVKATMAKIGLVREPERDRLLDTEGVLGVRLLAELTDGRVEEVVVHQPRGHPDVPFSDADLREKMRWLLEGVAPVEMPERLLALCNRLSTQQDVRALIQTCVVRS